jgi:hypothetical protein
MYYQANNLGFNSDFGGASTAFAFPMNTWYHLAGTFDGSAFRLYINGQEAASGTGTLGSTADSAFKIGTSGTCDPFGGQLDEVKVYNRALSSTEIQNIYDAGSAGVCTVQYTFSGFFQPIDNPPILNAVNAGRAIPIKFSLNGNQGLNILVPGYPASSNVTCGTAAEDAVEEIATPGASGLSYDVGSDQYTYVWKTDRSWANTCRTLVVKLLDGSIHTANFKFK